MSSTFDSTKTALPTVLDRVADLEIQLPDFQRDWIWDDERVRSLLASVSLSFPIGAIMLLETGNPNVRFKARPVEGAEGEDEIQPGHLILDGQQRITSLFQALRGAGPVETRDRRKRSIKRWYYIDMSQALDPNGDREDAIISVPEDRIVRTTGNRIKIDLASHDREFEAGAFPLSQIFNASGWRRAYNAHWSHDSDKSRFYDAFEDAVIKRFEQYLVPLIELKKQTPKLAVCQVFEKVNTGGVPLNVFELLTATYAADGFDLRSDWHRRRARFKRDRVLKTVRNDDFLQTVTLLATRERHGAYIAVGNTPENAPAISCKRKDVLQLNLDDYRKFADLAFDGYRRASKFLRAEFVLDRRWLPYRTQLIPLAGAFAAIGNKAHSDGVRSKFARWYWCGVFGELYGSATETRFARDFPELIGWIDDGPEPNTVQEANFVAARLRSLRTRNSAAYKGVFALLIRERCIDFQSGEQIDQRVYDEENIDIHHIFPRRWCKQRSIASDRYDSIINKSPLSARTNRIIGGKAPSEYLRRIEEDAGITSERLDTIIRSHRIDPEPLRLDDFDMFFDAREQELLNIIEIAMGKSITRVSAEELAALESGELVYAQ